VMEKRCRHAVNRLLAAAKVMGRLLSQTSQNSVKRKSNI
jgi:hypothetical protein